MVLLDLNQILIANLMVQVHSDPSMKINEGLIRHLVLNSLRMYNRQFRDSYGALVVCLDSKKYWRKEIFPQYKANRKKDRANSKVDWMVVYDALNRIREEITGNIPYKVICVDGAEADDVIATLTKQYHHQEQILIVSSDKDFVQLQKYPNVTQYSPYLRRFVRADDPVSYVKEHIIRGDSGDGIPNILSPDNVFLTEDKQKRLNSQKIADWLSKDPDEFLVNETMRRGYDRNKVLVDFDYIPKDLSKAIVDEYVHANRSGTMVLMNYMIKHGLTSLIEVLDEF